MDELAVSREAQASLVKFLVKLDLLNPEQLEKDYPSREECPISYFAKQGCFNEWDAIARVAARLEIKSYKIDKHNSDAYLQRLEAEALQKISGTRWWAHRALPAEISEDGILVMMANPLDHNTRSMLEFDLGRKIQIAIGSEREILALLSGKLQAARENELDAILDDSRTLCKDPSQDPAVAQDSNLVAADLDAAPIVRLVNKIFSDAVHLGASDIHITPEKEQLLVRVRVDGIMRTLFSVPNLVKGAVISRIKLLGGMDISEKRKPQDGRLRIKTGFGVKDLRISTVPTFFGENLVARILSSEIGKISFESLGMSPEIIKRFERMLAGSSQVVLVCGPTGSGKTSTLYAALLHLCDGRSSIVTVEDPIEYRIESITQIQVNNKVGMTFAEGLRSILRQDPDIIMVGEIRDGETADIAMQAAQTGHLVLSTIHTNSAPAAVTRLTDLGIPPFLSASSVGSIIAQRLVRTLCPACALPVCGAQLERVRLLGLDPAVIKAPKGCDECGGTGFKGRTAIYSFLEASDPVRAAIREGKSEAEVTELARAFGFRSLQEDGVALLGRGLTSLDELERVLGPFAHELENREHRARRFAATPATAKAASSPAEVKTAAGVSRRRVLLVEDDDDVRFILSTLLEREMFDVRQAKDGVDALQQVYQELPELILCDLMMPRMDGMELLEKLKRDARTAGIPLLMLTAADSEENELKLLGKGADDFVSKASSAEVMLARVHRLLARAAGTVHNN